MPLPKPNATKTAAAPAAPTTAAQPSGGRSRLPALPNGGLKPKGQGIQFLEIPKTMDRCFYVLRVLEVKQGASTKTNLERVEIKFEVLETDVPGIKIGSDIYKYLNLQGEQSLYFWPDFMSFALAANGCSPSDQEMVDEFAKDTDANYTEVVEQGGVTGNVLVCKYRRGPKKDGSGMTYFSDFEPASDEQIAKYTKAS